MWTNIAMVAMKVALILFNMASRGFHTQERALQLRRWIIDYVRGMQERAKKTAGDEDDARAQFWATLFKSETLGYEKPAAKGPIDHAGGGRFG